MKNKTTKEYKVKAWAVVNKAYLIDERVAFGSGCVVESIKMKGVYGTKKEAEQMRIRWNNESDFKTVPCIITYKA